jgi:beta-N-acetylhexosaminidase
MSQSGMSPEEGHADGRGPGFDPAADVSHRTLRERRPTSQAGRWVPALLVLTLVLAGVAAAVAAMRPASPAEPAAAHPTGRHHDPAAPPVSRPAAATSQPATSQPEQRCDPTVAVTQLPLRRRLAQLVMVGVDPSGSDQARRVVAAEQVGGIFIGGESTGLLTGGAVANVQEVASLGLLVAVDEEGGRVQRFDRIAGSLPSARRMAATMTPQQVRELARRRGAILRASGVTVDFAPSVDVSDQPTGAVIGDRSFAPDPELVVRYAGAFADGLRDADVLPVFKHFPGHGHASGDSHKSTATTPALAELERVDLLPYRRLLGAGLEAVMVGHLDVPGLTTPSTPASISPAAVGLLRNELGYHGLVFSDDLAGMRAISDRVDLPEAVRQSLAAGVDMALWTSVGRLGEVLDHLEQAVGIGALPQSRVDEAAARVLQAKGIDPCRLS